MEGNLGKDSTKSNMVDDQNPLPVLSPVSDPIFVSEANIQFSDVPELMQSEIFQNLGIFKLLTLRRVCKDWDSYITNESAPFMRTVAVPLSTLFIARRHMPTFRKAWSPANTFWRFAKKATTVLMYEDPPKEYSQWSSNNYSLPCHIWSEYNKQATADDRTCLINKAIYANTVADSHVFLHKKVNRPGFQTVVYQCDLNFAATSNLFRFKRANRFRYSVPFDDATLYIELSGEIMSYVQTEFDVEALQRLDTTRLPSSAATYFASNGSTPPTQVQIAEMIESREMLPKPEEALLLVKQLLSELDPGNTESLKHYSDGDLLKFAATAHPLVSILTNHYFKTATEDRGTKCDCGECHDEEGSTHSSDEEDYGHDHGFDFDDEDSSSDDEDNMGYHQLQVQEVVNQLMVNMLTQFVQNR